jgi:zinc protease
MGMNSIRKSSRYFGAALCLAVTALCAMVHAAPPQTASVKIPRLEYTDTKLPNGLRVIIAPDHTAPVYAIDVSYNVGSRNERPGRTGFAHLFEHMMFQGSKNVGKGEHFILVFNNGGNMNGTTNSDRTTYFEELPTNQLDLGLFLESDRMRALAITQANLDNQRKAVQEERRLGVDNEPYGKAGLDLDGLAYDNFSYKHSTIGSMLDLDHASVDDVSDFFRIYYAPNNAVLTLVGDLDPVQALEKVKKYFGDIPSQAVPTAPDLTEEDHYGERRETIYDGLARLPEIDMLYRTAPGATPDSFSADLLSIILGGGNSSRLYQYLVKDKQLATSATANFDGRIGPSPLYISATPRPGVKLEDLETALDAEIDAAAKTGVTAEEVSKAKAITLRQIIEQRQSDLFSAVLIGDFAVKFHDADLINTLWDKYKDITPEQVSAVAKKYLVRDQRAVVISLPAPQQPGAPGAAAASGGN